MNSSQNKKPRVLILFYSFSGQTSGLLNRLVAGLEENGVQVEMERLRPAEPLRFPVGTIPATLKMMLTTFLRFRIAIEPLSAVCFNDYDLTILAGPTWSYNPSGPVLSLIDSYGERLFSGKKVIPLISCRGYWRMHWRGLRKMLEDCGAQVVNKMIFSHPNNEPWRTIGVFLKIAGKSPERSPFWGRFYKRYGHSKKQLSEAERFGRIVGETLLAGASLEEIDFMTKNAVHRH